MTRRAVDLEAMSVTELLALSASAVGELRRRGVVRTRNAPLGDYAEWLAAKALGGDLAPNSERSFDLRTDDDRRVQVKARRVSEPPARGQLQSSPFRTWGFDDALFVLVDENTFEVRRASLVPLSIVEKLSTFRAHVNGSIVFMDDNLMRHTDAIDVTDRMRRAAGSPVERRPTTQPQIRARRSQPLRAQPIDEPVAESSAPAATTTTGVDWIWLQHSAIEDFKTWRVGRGATKLSAASYASGARALLRYCRTTNTHPYDGVDAFFEHLRSEGDLSGSAISNYRSHAREFVGFLKERRFERTDR